jgi:protein tyrosine phosphatase
MNYMFTDVMQGPLSHTCPEFWYMTWEQESPLIIMLTTVVERGRVKCHKYWPDLDRYDISYRSGIKGIMPTQDDFFFKAEKIQSVPVLSK